MSKAIILAAGRGSRMLTLTQDKPKCLVEYGGRPLLHWQLDALRSAGVRDIALVTGYRREALAGIGSAQFHNPRWEETNMVGSLACAKEWLEDGPCIVSYSDIVFGAEAVEDVLKSDRELSVAYDPNWLSLWKARFENPLDDAESFKIDPSMRILEIGLKSPCVEEIQGQYMGLLRFTPQAWGAMSRMRDGLDPVARDRLDMTGALQRLILSGYEVYGVPIRCRWAEFDSQEDLRRTGELFGQ